MLGLFALFVYGAGVIGVGAAFAGVAFAVGKLPGRSARVVAVVALGLCLFVTVPRLFQASHDLDARHTEGGYELDGGTPFSAEATFGATGRASIERDLAAGAMIGWLVPSTVFAALLAMVVASAEPELRRRPRIDLTDDASGWDPAREGSSNW